MNDILRQDLTQDYILLMTYLADIKVNDVIDPQLHLLEIGAAFPAT